MNLESLIDRYELGARLMPYAVTNLTADHLAARPGPGAWSIGELAIHLLDSDLVGGDRMKRVIAEDEPTLLFFDQDAWTSRLSGPDLPVAEAADLFAAHRRWMTRLLRRCSESDFSRVGHHTEDGRMTLAQVLAAHVGHLDHHLRFLYAKRGNLGVAIYPRYSYALE